MKIAEHAKRTQQYASMLPALKKKAEKDSLKSEEELQAAVEKIRQDADAIRTTKKDVETQRFDLKPFERKFNDPKLDQKTWEKTAVFVKALIIRLRIVTRSVSEEERRFPR
ncbi:MAG: hypothetical protein NTY19_50865 [Planctomycetota bacterium]|nr:hypothetical protein [Planctomycetota bacterium]